MPNWTGKVISGDLEMEASVLYTPPTQEQLGYWNGSGIADAIWPLEKLETNIGTILVTQVNIRGKMFTIEFQGSGSFKGK